MNQGFEMIVDTYYQPLYRFALSLSRSEDRAGDLTQQTFLLWARKGHQLRDDSKVKTWLFTTLYREFLQIKRRKQNRTEVDLETAEHEIPALEPSQIASMDAAAIMESLQRLEPTFRDVLTLYYIQDLSYKEIADVLNCPIGTVMSRLSRAKTQLRELLDEQSKHPKDR